MDENISVTMKEKEESIVFMKKIMKKVMERIEKGEPCLCIFQFKDNGSTQMLNVTPLDVTYLVTQSIIHARDTLLRSMKEPNKKLVNDMLTQIIEKVD